MVIYLSDQSQSIKPATHVCFSNYFLFNCLMTKINDHSKSIELNFKKMIKTGCKKKCLLILHKKIVLLENKVKQLNEI